MFGAEVQNEAGRRQQSTLGRRSLARLAACLSRVMKALAAQETRREFKASQENSRDQRLLELLSFKFNLIEPRYHLRRSNFLQTFNASPDETAYYRMWEAQVTGASRI